MKGSDNVTDVVKRYEEEKRKREEFISELAKSLIDQSKFENPFEQFEKDDSKPLKNSFFEDPVFEEIDKGIEAILKHQAETNLKMINKEDLKIPMETFRWENSEQKHFESVQQFKKYAEGIYIKSDGKNRDQRRKEAK